MPTSLQPKVPIKAHKYNIGLYVSKIESMSEEDIYDLTKNAWVPPDYYEFPYTKSRKFSQDWLRLFPYICYSISLLSRWCFLSSMCYTKHRPLKICTLLRLRHGKAHVLD